MDDKTFSAYAARWKMTKEELRKWCKEWDEARVLVLKGLTKKYRKESNFRKGW